MRRYFSHPFALSTLAALLAGCSFVYDFDQFYPADATAALDASIDLAEEDDGGSVDAAADAPLDAGVDAGPSLTPLEFAERFAAAVCAKTLRCGDKLGFAVLLQELCHPTVGARYISLFVGDFGDRRFDVAAAERCLLGLDSIDCSVSTDFTADCAVELRGEADVGAECVSGLDCRSDACEDRPAACGRECVATLADGGLCTSNSECEPDLRCRGGTCRAVGMLTEVCDASQDCAPGYWCERDSRTCRVLPNEGERCESDFGGDPCRGALVCTRASGLSGVCRVGVAPGASCNFDTPCQPGLRCSVSSVCVPLVGTGGACASAQNCPPLHECIAEVCTPYGVVGETCSPTLPCAEGNCFTGRCALERNGASCSGDSTLLSLDRCAGFCDRDAADGPTCTERRVIGARCASDLECAAGLECTGAGVSACAACAP